MLISVFSVDEVMIKYKGDHSYMYNVKTGTTPAVLHGNGPIKVSTSQRYDILVALSTLTAVFCLSDRKDCVKLTWRFIFERLGFSAGEKLVVRC